MPSRFFSRKTSKIGADKRTREGANREEEGKGGCSRGGEWREEEVRRWSRRLPGWGRAPRKATCSRVGGLEKRPVCVSVPQDCGTVRSEGRLVWLIRALSEASLRL